MATWSRWQTRKAEFGAIARMAPHATRLLDAAPWSAAALLSERARKTPDSLAIAYLDRRYDWCEVDEQVNRTARAFQSLGISAEDRVALLMDNRPEFLFALTALSRLRAVAALINTNVTGKALCHAIDVATPEKVLVGMEHAEKVRDVLPKLASVSGADVLIQRDPESDLEQPESSFDDLIEEQRAAPPDGLRAPRGDEMMAYIYTSGTTGLPKAALIKNKRFLSAGLMFGKAALDLTPDDTIYVTLPFYHSNAMFGGWCAALHTGAGVAIRRKFSASNFWADVVRYEATAFVYIGELCRYLLNQPERPEETRHRLRRITGNGLRPDIWERFQTRFRIPEICEFYGATEGNVALVNLAGRPGMVGRLQPGSAVIRCDLETGEPLRNSAGRCDRVAEGETGLIIGRIGGVTTYDGYVDEVASEKKVLAGVFREGDRYFNTGDLVVVNDDGWISFADRVGDTFRWKGENVSTNEVAEILNGAPGVLESNVYGVEVPGADGRAGMASLNCAADFSIDAFAAFVNENLPVYQRPYFVRLQQEMRITGTFKHQKTDYRAEGFDPGRVEDPLYFLDGAEYVPLDDGLHEAIRSQQKTLR